MKHATKVIVGIIVIALIGIIFISNNTPKESGVTTTVPSRELMEVGLQIVREDKPTPYQSSRFYAVIASDYYNNPSMEYSTESLRSVLRDIVSNDSQEIIDRPVGEEYWNSPRAPFSPNAKDGSRFIIDEGFTYTVPPPPEFMSSLYMEELEKVKEASLNRTPEQSEAINFWGGIPGTEAPAGIWQNRLWSVSQKHNLDDHEYAYVQMILAQAIADSFMECWDVKYEYWTKRPDMADPTIQTAMDNPPFPSYVSGHSTNSYTAATVLSHFFPSDADIYMADAEEAKNSRLWAGIHFAYDNDEGAKLGTAIGNYVIEKLSLESVR